MKTSYSCVLTMHYYTLISTFFRNTMRSHVMVMSRASMAAARRTLVKMGEHAQKFVSPREFGTTVLSQKKFVGRHGEFERKSCQAYKAAGERSSGLYTITDDSNQSFQVFCDFASEPGFAWNLIQSFRLSQTQVNTHSYD